MVLIGPICAFRFVKNLTVSIFRVSMQCPYIWKGNSGPSDILSGNEEVGLKTSVDVVAPFFVKPPVKMLHITRSFLQ